MVLYDIITFHLENNTTPETPCGAHRACTYYCNDLLRGAFCSPARTYFTTIIIFSETPRPRTVADVQPSTRKKTRPELAADIFRGPPVKRIVSFSTVETTSRDGFHRAFATDDFVIGYAYETLCRCCTGVNTISRTADFRSFGYL